jgi:hypothetical protein
MVTVPQRSSSTWVPAYCKPVLQSIVVGEQLSIPSSAEAEEAVEELAELLEHRSLLR